MGVEKLINELGKDLVGYATDRVFARELPIDEASELATFVHVRVDQAVDDRAVTIGRSGKTIACTRGCNGCCEEPIMVFRPEAARVAQWLSLPENADARAWFVTAYPAWNAAIGDTVATLSEQYETDPLNFVEHHVNAWRKSVLCAFNRNGECAVYPVRPTVCRTGHALETNTHCSGAAEGHAERATFVPLENFVERTRILLRATHNAMRGTRGRPESLPHAVHALLRE